MKTIDLERFYGRIKAKGYNLSKVALHLGITRMSLYNKLNGKTSFKATEVDKLSTLLGKDIIIVVSED